MRQKSKMSRRALLGATAGAGSMVMLARHGRAAAEKPQYGGTLKVAYNIAPGALDAHVGRSGGDAYYWRQMYDQLVDADPSLKPAPASSLAESWDLSDPKAMVLKLRKGVLFHDGTPFNAEAVKFNIERVLDPATKATPRAAFLSIDSITVVDEHLVRLNLKRPWGSGMSMLADRGGAMNSPTAVKALGVDYAFKPSGTGPYKLAEVVSGSHVRLVRNEKYWRRDADNNPLPYLDEIIIRVVQDPTVQVAGLRSGEIDLVYLPYRDVGTFLEDPKYNVSVFQGGNIGYLLAFNTAKPPMDNVNLRLAVAHAVNPEAINKAAFFNRAIVAKGGMWPTGAWAYDPTVARPSYSPAKARDYLKAGGKPNGFEIDAVTWASDTLSPSAEIVKAQLGAVGIKLNLKVFETSVATDRFYSTGEAPVFLTAWSRYPEPDWIAALNYSSTGYYNASKVKDARMDALIEDGAANVDIDKRKAIYRKVDEVVLGEGWITPLIYGVTYAAAPKKVQGLDSVFGWDAKFNLHQMWIKKT